jgi:hypothetical protein
MLRSTGPVGTEPALDDSRAGGADSKGLAPHASERAPRTSANRNCAENYCSSVRSVKDKFGHARSLALLARDRRTLLRRSSKRTRQRAHGASVRGVRDRDATTSGIGSTHRQFSGRYDGLRRGALEGRRTKLNAPDPASKVDSGREDRRVVRRKRNVSLIRVRVRSVCEVRMALAPPPRPAARSASLDALRTRRLDRGLVHHRGLRSRARHEHRTRRPVDQPLCRRPQDPVLEVEAS